jgi:molybdate transport system substrate-binding protein
VLACSVAAAPRPEVIVAAAANLTNVFQALGPKFEEQTGIHPVFSFGSTALLAQQIEHSAPFDVFAAADTEHVKALERKGLLTPGSRAVYAEGALALWMPNSDKATVRTIQDLAKPEIRIVAIANPKLAPYGAAAVEALKRAGLWDRVQPKIVYAENINMARQYGASGNADAVFTAYPLVFRDRGLVLSVNPELYPRLDQAVGVLARAPNPDAAQRFAAFLLSSEGQAVLKAYGYGLPARQTIR